ncbi:hypothetical protein G7Z17_g4105 [Cylindrodendrum hubeiense]|uniref:Uncharacterized protein n=1 Tax=Cylindrodendrum hubeiense TaxID=595255 RepID=A0A9P5HHH6_9HYPO|nr:hypothetical protein G7Z17_g4105 [Cylindrodendrum hubeiense]
MAGQRTFTLIPQQPGRNDSPERQSPAARPMTSKQVQKAYKAANRAPRLSRAERIKEEKAEQERIRKEFEKEKASAKARAARDKKKGKEQAERDEKRKKGLPTVSVRPSQDTIAWFVRGNGTAKKRDSEGRGVSASETPEPVTPCPARGLKLGNILEEGDEEEDETVKEDEVEAEVEPPAKTHPEPNHGPEPEVEAEGAAPDLDDLDEEFEDDLALELLQDVEAIAKTTSIRKPEHNNQQTSPVLLITTPITPLQPNLTNRYEQDLGLQRQPRIDPSPPRPPPAKLARHSPSPSPSPPRQQPPMSTQAILFNFDDFFPSSSQQARELEEEIAEKQRSTAREAAPDKPEQPQAPPEPSLPEPIIDSPSPPPRRFFTSSGSHELMSLALHRSRRTAALEQIQQRERERIQAGIAVRQAEARARRDRARAAAMVPSKPVFKPEKAVESQPHIRPPTAAITNNKPVVRPERVVERQPQIKPSAAAITNNKPVLRPERVVEHQPEIKPPAAAIAHSKPAKPEKATERQQIKPGPEDNKENIVPLDPPAGGLQVLSASQETEYGGDWVDEIALELMI